MLNRRGDDDPHSTFPKDELRASCLRTTDGLPNLFGRTIRNRVLNRTPKRSRVWVVERNDYALAIQCGGHSIRHTCILGKVDHNPFGLNFPTFRVDSIRDYFAGRSIDIKQFDVARFDMDNAFAVAANLVRPQSKKFRVASSPKVEACLFGPKLQVFGAKDQVAIPGNAIVDNGSGAIAIDPFDERNEALGCRRIDPDGSFAANNEIPLVRRKRKSGSTRQFVRDIGFRVQIKNMDRTNVGIRTMLNCHPRKPVATHRVWSLGQKPEGIRGRQVKQFGRSQFHYAFSNAESNARPLGAKSMFLTKPAASFAPNSRSIPLSSHSTLSGPA